MALPARLDPGAPLRRALPGLSGDVGRAIRLGLELAAAADIVGTVLAAPVFEHLGVLGLVVFICPGVGSAFEVDINGHWLRQHVERHVRSRTGHSV